MENRTKRRLVQLGLVVILLAVGVGGMMAFILNKPPLAKQQPKVQPPLVRTVATQSGPVTVEVRGEGTVRPLRESILSPQVGGRVAQVSPELIPGGAFKKGDVLLTIDPTDFELAVVLARAGLEEAQTSLEKAREENQASLEEWKRLYKDKGDPPDLVAKVPQLEAARANLLAAEAKLRQAELNLERTRLKAPFDGRVVSKSVDLGQQINAGQTVAQVFSSETAEIVVHLEDSDLAWVKVPGLTTKSKTGSPARVTANFAGQDLSWQGRVARSEAGVDDRTRLVPVVVRVDNPYASLPPLEVGMFVKVAIDGSSLPHATLLPRAALKEGKMVWLVGDDEVLRFHSVEVARAQEDTALLSPGLPDGSRVVLSPLKAVSDGMRVRTFGQEGEATPQAETAPAEDEPAPAAAGEQKS